MSGSASGKFDLNHLSVLSLVLSRSNSVVGANRVQVNVLSYRKQPEGGLEYAEAGMTWKVGKGQPRGKYLTLFGSAISMNEWRGHM